MTDAPVEGDATTEVATLTNVCTVEGFVWDGQKCTKESDAKGYRCNFNDAAECKAQCELGNADSCYSLASLDHEWKGRRTSRRDRGHGSLREGLRGRQPGRLLVLDLSGSTGRPKANV